MRYQNPELLYLLFAIAVPIIVHLFNFRKHKKIYFSSIRFLKYIKKTNKNQSQIKNLLILLSRILAIFFLVLAFSKPFIPIKDNKKVENIFIYIDNSLSMDINYNNGNLLQKAKERAMEIIKSHSNVDAFFLITNDFESKHTKSYSAESIKKQIENVNNSSRIRSISDVSLRMNSINTGFNYLYFISDMQINTLKLVDLNHSNENSNIYLIPIIQKTTKNISIDSCFTSSPIFVLEDEITLKVILNNNGKEDVNDEVLFLYLDEKQKSQQYINLLAGEKKEITFKILLKKEKSIIGELRINDFPVSFDNNLFFTINRSNKVNIVSINNNTDNQAFSSLFLKDTILFNYQSFNSRNINYNTLLKQDFVILNGIEKLSTGLLNSLNKITENGGSLLIVPNSTLENTVLYNQMLKSLDINTIYKKVDQKLKINKFTLEHPLYKNVFKEALSKVNYPLSKKSYKLNNTIISSRIISLENNNEFLLSYNREKGNIYQFSSPLDNQYNDFTKHALFVPTLINMATRTIKNDLLYYTIGLDKEIFCDNISIRKTSPHLKGINLDIIPTISTKSSRTVINTHNQVYESGIYDLEYDDNKTNSFAFNYDRNESIISSLSIADIDKQIKENNINNTSIITSSGERLISTIKEQQNGKELWKISIMLSLLFFAIEIILIKLLKS